MLPRKRYYNYVMPDAIVYKLHDSAPGLVLAEDAGSRLYLKELAHVGTFTDGAGREFSVDDALMDHWLRLHREMLADGIKVPVPTAHTDDVEANRGHVVGARRGRNSRGQSALFGVFKFRDRESEKLAGSADVSVYVPPTRRGGNGKIYKRPIAHVALTDYPVIPGLDGFTPIAASLAPGKGALPKDKEKTMSMGTLAEKLGLPTADKDEPTLEADVLIAVQQWQQQVKDLETRISQLEALVVELGGDPAEAGGGGGGEDRAVAASFVGMLRENREAKIDRLVLDSSGKSRISVVVGKALKDRYCEEKTLRLSLAGRTDDFDSVVAALSQNEPRHVGEKSRAQVLHDGGRNGGKDERNYMLEAAEERAKVGAGRS